MELNKRTLKILIGALQIAKETTSIAYSKNLLNSKLGINPAVPVFLETQATLIDSLEEYEKLINDFQELLSRQNDQD